MSLPRCDENDLEEILSSPYPEDLALARALDGDILVLGAGGKMGPTLVMRVVRALKSVGSRSRVIAVSRFSEPLLQAKLSQGGAEVLPCDLLDGASLRALPDCPNVIYMTGMKFGSSGNQPLTWMMNTYLPGQVAERFRGSRIVAFSTGNVYPLVSLESGGSIETDGPDPIGEYAQSCLGRERILSYFSERYQTPMCLLRLNYAVEPRYGVLLDIAERVYAGIPVSLEMGSVNVIWQGDANSMCFRSLPLCSSPAAVFNLAGPEILSVREVAGQFGRLLGKEPVFVGRESSTALLSNGARMYEAVGTPKVAAQEVIHLVAQWVQEGGATLGKPTKFEVRNGRF